MHGWWILLFLVLTTTAQCPICRYGGIPPNLTLQPALLGGQRSCGELLQVSQTARPPCEPWLQAGDACNCPTCSICPDGTTPPFPWQQLSSGATCGELQTVAKLVHVDECAPYWPQGVRCGCAPVGLCSLCANGRRPPDRSREIAPGVTCLDLFIQASVETDEEQCPTWLQRGIQQCDCPLPNDTCPYCGRPGAMVGDNNCQELHRQVAWEALDSNECRAWQATVGQACGCNAVEAPVCRICGSNQRVDSTMSLIVDNKPTSCAELEWNPTGMACDLLQNTFGNACCPRGRPTSSPRTPSPTSISTPVPIAWPRETEAPMAIIPEQQESSFPTIQETNPDITEVVDDFGEDWSTEVPFEEELADTSFRIPIESAISSGVELWMYKRWFLASLLSY